MVLSILMCFATESGCGHIRADDGADAPAPAPALGPNDVMGMVVSGTGDPGPIAGARVLVAGTLTTTDLQGRFIVRNAPPTYDVIIGLANWGDAYFGVTSRTPVLTSQAPNISPSRATISVSYPASTVVDAKRIGFIDRGPAYGTQEAPPAIPWVSWSQAFSQITTKFLLLEYTTDSFGTPTHYAGMALDTFTLENGGSRAWAPQYGPVSETKVTGSVDTVPSQTLYEAYLTVSLSGGAYAPLNREVPLRQPPFTFVVPQIAGASFAAVYSAYDTGKPGSAGGANSIVSVPIGADGTLPHAIVPEAPHPLSPADGATGFAPGTVFTWQGEGTCEVKLWGGNQGFQPSSIRLVTRAGTVTMPDASTVGVTPLKLTTYGWIVTCWSPDTMPGVDPVTVPRLGWLGTSGRSVRWTIVTGP
jgi:hypothetical protein